jgi:hypothetical protein
LTEKIAQLSEPSSELQTLRGRERSLVAELAGAPQAEASKASGSPAGGALGGGQPGGGAAPVQGVQAVMAAEHAQGVMAAGSVLIDLRDDPQTAIARSRLQAVSSKYNELLSRIERANLDLEVTRAAFKYQYTVVRPPELARAPSKPNVPMVFIATLLGSALLSMLVPGGLDLAKGRFVERWQVERRLKLPLLGELAPPRR